MVIGRNGEIALCAVKVLRMAQSAERNDASHRRDTSYSPGLRFTHSPLHIQFLHPFLFVFIF
jgi:hypothetical protein